MSSTPNRLSQNTLVAESAAVERIDRALSEA
jgi:hypothetical protein